MYQIHIYHKTGWLVAKKEKGNGSTFGDHLGREHFKHQLEEHLGEHLGDRLGDQLGLQPLNPFQQDPLPTPHLDLTLVRRLLPDQADISITKRDRFETKQEDYPLPFLPKTDPPSLVLLEPFGKPADNFFQYPLPCILEYRSILVCKHTILLRGIHYTGMIRIYPIYQNS